MSWLLWLQSDDEAPARLDFGAFMQAVPHWGFIIIHSTLIVTGMLLSRRVRSAGFALAANGFLIFCLAELSYITYHLGYTHFLFAHTVAEVLDAVAFVTIAVGLVRKT